MTQRIVDVMPLNTGDSRCYLYKEVRNNKKNPNWICKIKLDGSKRLRKSTKETNLERAKDKARRWLDESIGKIAIGQPIHNLKFESVIGRYKKALETKKQLRQITKHNFDFQISIIDSFLFPYFSNKYLHQITEKVVGDYAKNRRTGGIRANSNRTPLPKTINRDFGILRQIFRFLKNEKLIADIPEIKDLSNARATEDGRREAITYVETRIIKKKINDWVALKDQPPATEKWKQTIANKNNNSNLIEYRRLLKLAIGFMMYSGIRPSSELNSIKWNSVKYEKNLVMFEVRTSKLLGKRKSKTRQVVAMKQLKEYICDYKKHCEWNKNGNIFVHPKGAGKFEGKPIKSFQGQWSRFLRFCNIKDKPMYCLRHYYATTRILRGKNIPLPALAENMGTSTEILLKTYSHVTSTMAKESLSSLAE